MTVELPSLLVGLVGMPRELEVQGSTLREVLDDLVRRHPSLGVHLFDEAGVVRRHVLCLHNGCYTRRRDGLEASVAPGDKVTLLQSVAGG